MQASPLYYLYTDKNNNNIYIKREDLLPFSFGGNKYRIALEFLEDCKNKGCNHIIGYGGPRSNLSRVIANLCSANNIKCSIVCPPDDVNAYFDCNNFKMIKYFGAEIVECSKNNVAETVQNTIDKSIKNGFKPYYINGDKFGKGNEATPVKAYVKVFDEILNQQKELNINFDKIYFACGTCMTFSGMYCGKILNNSNVDIVGISVARSKQNSIGYIKNYIYAYLNSLNVKKNIDENSIDFIDDYAIGYGQKNDEIMELIPSLMKNFGIALDSTYTGKAFWGMQKQLENIKNQNVLFMHTGGIPLFFDDINQFF